MTQIRKRGVELSRRAIDVQPSTVDESNGSFPLIAATETPVRTFIPDPKTPEARIEVDEVLLAEGLDFSRVAGMPLMDNHMLERGLEATLGRVDDVRIEGGQIVATGVFAPSRRSIATDMKAGFFRQISAGFTVNSYEITEREGDVPLAVATSWTLHEVSIVPVGADPNAIVSGTRSRKLYPMPTFTRKRSKPRKQERKMDEDQIEDLVVAAEEAIDAVVEAVEDAVDAEVEISDELLARARGLRKSRAKRKAARAEADEDEADTKNEDEQEARGKRKSRSDDEAELEAELEEQLRKLRAKRKAARAEADEDGAEPLTEEEDKENSALERSARKFGLDGFVKGLRSVDAKPAFIKRALQKEMAKVGARGVSTADLRPANHSDVRSADRVRGAYDKLNKR